MVLITDSYAAVLCMSVSAVMLQPLDHEFSENSRHKFMVQSMFAPDDVTENHEQLVSFVTF